jgi:hypothetical protein
MPDRFIRESALTTATLSSLSHFAERLFWRLVVVADDYGRFNANVHVIAGRCMPLVSGSTPPHITEALDELVAAGTVVLYSVDGKNYAYFPEWNRYQQTRAKKSKFPPPPTSADICSQMQTNVPVFVSESVCESVCDTYTSVAEPPDDGVSPEDLMQGWNDLALKYGLAKVSEFNTERKRKAKARLTEHPALDFWNRVFTNIGTSEFLRGVSKPSNGHPNWRCNFDWLIRNESIPLKIFEGEYNAKASG